MKQAPKTFLLVLLGLIIAYLAGPQLEVQPLSPELPELNLSLESVADYVITKERGFEIRPDNEARIIWYSDSLKSETEYALLYLHGFGASWYEGFPTHINFAREIEANLYLSRLKDHGLKGSEVMLKMEPSALYETAKEALLIAKQLGEKIIVMGTSTGATLAIKLAADFPELIHSLVLLSPNVEINNPAAFLLDGPWGLQIARQVGGGSKYRNLEVESELEGKYWYHNYRWEGTVYLGKLISATMKPEVFAKVEQPVFMGYYYKNEEEQDPTVRIDAALEMFDQLGTKQELKRKIAFPNAGVHVIGCEATSGSYKRVGEEVLKFYKEVISSNPL